MGLEMTRLEEVEVELKCIQLRLIEGFIGSIKSSLFILMEISFSCTLWNSH